MQEYRLEIALLAGKQTNSKSPDRHASRTCPGAPRLFSKPLINTLVSSTTRIG
jgi:hypothetical protein